MKIIAIGNAIVDVLSQIDDDFLKKNSLTKGSMSLIGVEKSESLEQIEPIKVDCGGSAANTVAAISQLGISSGFIGKVCDDIYGQEFIKKISSTSTKFLNDEFHKDPTAKSFVLVGTDAQRTMCTYLGCASEITEEDIKEEYFTESEFLYLEGYLWDKPQTIAALKKAIKIAKAKNIKVAFSASDSFCVQRHKEDFLNLLENDLDILFANEDEFCQLSGNNKVDNDTLLNFFAAYTNLTAIVTRSEKGSVVIDDNSLTIVPAFHINNLVDTTGAGDAYAAGFLYKLLSNASVKDAAKFGNLLAAKIIQKFGARFESDEIRDLDIS